MKHHDLKQKFFSVHTFLHRKKRRRNRKWMFENEKNILDSWNAASRWNASVPLSCMQTNGPSNLSNEVSLSVVDLWRQNLFSSIQIQILFHFSISIKFILQNDLSRSIQLECNFSRIEFLHAEKFSNFS